MCECANYLRSFYYEEFVDNCSNTLSTTIYH